MRIAADGASVLTSRNGIDFTDEFAELADVFGETLDGRAAVLDGEVVVYNDRGEVDFGLLQERRGRYQRHPSTRGQAHVFEDLVPRFLAFDLLRLGDQDLTGRPYDQRRQLLVGLAMPDVYRVSVVPAFTFDELVGDRVTPETLLERAAAAAYEGLVVKLRSAPYLPGQRSDAWRKHPLTYTTEVVIAGWRPGQGRLAGLVGGLLLGAHDPVTGDLVYIGDVGTGLSQADRASLTTALEPLERTTHPFALQPPREDIARARWVQPRLVGEVVYRKFTHGALGVGRLRHTAWRGLRADRSPDEALLPGAPAGVGEQPRLASDAATVGADVAGERVTVQVERRRLTLSNLGKPLYPDGFTKGEVINYYTRIAAVLLPHLRGRPVTFIRWPDGVEGEQWFEKNVPRGAPNWLSSVWLTHSGSRRPGESTEYPLLDGLPALVWAANLAALELHVPQWTVDAHGQQRLPDRVVFDLDPGPGTSIVDCCRVAERLHDLLASDGLVPFATTSGAKGMQLYCGVATSDAAAPAAYAKHCAQRLAQQTPDRVTTVMAKAQRVGRVLVDWSQNNPAKTTISPYSLRGRDHPTVATPITWDEVHACRRLEQLVFTADDVLERMAERGDLSADLLGERNPLPSM